MGSGARVGDTGDTPRTSRRLCLWFLFGRLVSALVLSRTFVAGAGALIVSDDRGRSLEVEGGVGGSADRF
jgi:hypothetical protein